MNDSQVKKLLQERLSRHLVLLTEVQRNLAPPVGLYAAVSDVTQTIANRTNADSAFALLRDGLDASQFRILCDGRKFNPVRLESPLVDRMFPRERYSEDDSWTTFAPESKKALEFWDRLIFVIAPAGKSYLVVPIPRPDTHIESVFGFVVLVSNVRHSREWTYDASIITHCCELLGSTIHLMQLTERENRLAMMGATVANTLHDLNNIFAAISGRMELLQIENPDSQHLSKLRESLQHGISFCREGLVFASGNASARIKVSIVGLVRGYVSFMKEALALRKITLSYNYKGIVGSIAGIPSRLYEVILNLCSNAVDAMPNGGTLTLEVSRCVDSKSVGRRRLDIGARDYLCLSVSDTGTGIAPTIIDKIFDPFFTTKGKSGGTGLGLASVLAIVEAHDGIVDVVSQQGRGTTFYVYLPLAP